MLPEVERRIRSNLWKWSQYLRHLCLGMVIQAIAVLGVMFLAMVLLGMAWLEVWWMDGLCVVRPPDRISAQKDGGWRALTPCSGGAWEDSGTRVVVSDRGHRLDVSLESPHQSVSWVRLRWNQPISSGWRFLGDHWERAYGDLEWRGIVPERAMPWYFAVHLGDATVCCGVKTGARALCCWQVDPQGVSLWLDVRCGGSGVELGQRALQMATVVEYHSADGENPFDAIRSFCRLLCDRPVLPDHCIYGGNNWYYSYGENSQDQVLEDARLISELSPDANNRPYYVVDDGWQVCHPSATTGGPWDRGNYRFPDMPGLAADMRAMGIRPGIWIRPLLTQETVPSDWLLPTNHPLRGTGRQFLDPSVDAVLERVKQDIHRLVAWGYQLIKFDFTTYDVTGKWGSEMGTSMTSDGWSFADRTRTTAEIITALYESIAEAAGSAPVIACNTISHLAAGVFALQRTGDDTSGLDFNRVTRYGVNALAFRMPHHHTLYLCDADCVGLTDRIPWSLNRMWLDLLSRSGTPLFVSAAPSAVGPEQRRALEAALARAATPMEPAEPLDWMGNTCPTTWWTADGIMEYNWWSD